MAEKVTFDPVNRLIIVDNGITELDAKVDLYSDAKEDWASDATLNKLRLPFRTIGGDPLGGGLTAGAYFFLQNQNGWRLRPYEGDHELRIVGNFYPEDAGSPVIVPTLGDYTVLVRLETSSLTQATDAETLWTMTMPASSDPDTAAYKMDRALALADWGIIRGEAFANLPVTLVSSSDHLTPTPGLTPTGQYLKENELSSGWQNLSGSFIDVGQGTYVLSELTAVETDTEAITIRVTADGADAVVITFWPK
jgi:hypothetical protein